MKDQTKPADKKYIFIGKTLFFPSEKIVCVGDLHLGYESSLRQRGLDFSIGQFKEMEEELVRTLGHIKAKYGKIEKIIFLGDVKHHFNYMASEKEEMKKLLGFLRKFVENRDRDVVFVRGNHEKNEKNGKFIDYFIEKDIIFVHGNREFIEIYDRMANLVVMGHIHPSIVLRDKMKVKIEKYKCFLVGKYKKKEFVVVPSFLSITEGVSANEFNDETARGYDFSIIPQKELENFEVFIVSELGEEALSFGKLNLLR